MEVEERLIGRQGPFLTCLRAVKNSVMEAKVTDDSFNWKQGVFLSGECEMPTVG